MSDLSASSDGAGSRGGTMQTFSFADSKLGYRSSGAALVVRVKSTGTSRRPRHVTATTTTHKTRDDAAAATAAAAAADAAYDDDVVMTKRCSHVADETGNFTLAPRRYTLTYDLDLEMTFSFNPLSAMVMN